MASFLTGAAPSAAEKNNPYLLLVSFSSDNFQSITSRKLQSLNQSPYEGVAVPLIDAYDADKHAPEDFAPAMARMRKHSTVHVWPWIFWNRLVGRDPKPGHRRPGDPADTPYFRAITGMDLYNQTGALDDFYNLYRISLQAAKQLHSPGIVIDLEVYNNYELYSTENLAKSLHKNRDEVEHRLQSIGRELTNIAMKEYPEAVVWFFFTGMAETPFPHERRSVAHVVAGMLERAKEAGSPLRIVSGGEVTGGYCYQSLEDLERRTEARKQKFREPISKYPNLRVGATLSPWDGSSERTGWMNEERCGASQLRTLDDFTPLFDSLLSQHEFVWIYAADEAPYNPYNRSSAKPYHDALAASLQRIQASASVVTLQR